MSIGAELDNAKFVVDYGSAAFAVERIVVRWSLLLYFGTIYILTKGS